LSETKAPITMSDASSSGATAPPRQEVVTATERAPSSDASNVQKTEPAKSETVKAEVETVTAKPGETASSEDKPVETKSSETASPEIKTVEVGASDKANQKTDEAATPAPANTEPVKTELSAAESATTDETKVELKTDGVKIELPAPDISKPPAAIAIEAKLLERADDKVKSPIETGAVSDAKKDQTRLPGDEKAVASKPDPAAILASKGQISVFVSRKDSKLYVRQNFAPLFDVPVTIKPDERPLGTHVFTAQVDKDDANFLHWSAVSLPAPARAERRDEDERVSRRRKIAGAVEMKVQPVPDSPAEALDRLNIPADTMARINQALTTGGSIIVSDQGITAGETGEGTDFIVSLR
jgi:hypothetical protein